MRPIWMLTVTISALLSAPLAASSPEASLGADWIRYVDRTATRLSADPSVGTADAEEKDMVAGDLDRDGDMDVIVVRKVPFSNAGGQRNVLLMNEDGVMTDRTADFAPEMLDLTDDRDIALADLDGDGWLDAITVTTFFEQPRIYMNLGQSAGVWQGLDWQPARLPTFAPAPKFCSIATGDVTGNGRPDIFFVDYENDLEDRLLINDGSGFFTDETALRMTELMSDSTFGTDAAIIDVDGDLDNDIVKNNASGSAPPPGSQEPAVIVLYNSGGGFFDFRQEAYDVAPYMFEPGDFNNDDRIDLYVVDDGQDVYLLNEGNDANDRVIWSVNMVTQSPKTNFFGGNVAVGYLDDDEFLDVYVADVDTDIPGCDRQPVALRNMGDVPDITILDPLNGASREWMPAGTFDVLLVDIDGNGILDIWTANCVGHHIFMAEAVFADGFESGDTSVWSNTVP